MDNQEIFNQIRELQKQRTLLSAQDAALVNKINELRDKIALKNIKKGYYTDNNGLYCKVYDIKEDAIFVYEVNTSELYATMEVYPYYRAFSNAYCRECWAEMQKHQPFGWTKLIGEIEYSLITDVDDTINYSDAIKEYTFADGTPFGIKEEE